MEKCEDIMRQMREGDWNCNLCDDDCDCPNATRIMTKLADRFEAAYKAETAELDKIAKDAMVYITKVEAERDHEKKIANFAIDNIAKIRAEGVMLIYDMKTDAEKRDSFSPADVRDYIRRIKDALFPVDRTDEKK